MFGQQNDNDDTTKIPDQSIDGVIQDTAPETVDAPKSKPTTSAKQSSGPANAANDLLDIKQKVLQELSPLVTHLDQSPEEKFRTIMMMIQASDDQELLVGAHEAASHIEDDKARAQALLDIVNEINYFTAQPPEV